MKSVTFVDNPSISHKEGRDDDKGSSSKEGTVYILYIYINILYIQTLVPAIGYKNL
jgi:hypothetical protein